MEMDREQEIKKRLHAFYSGKAAGKYNSKPMNTIRVLILEDDLETLAVVLERIKVLEQELEAADIAVTVLSEYTQVEEYINQTQKLFDVILLDRDCKICGSFHCLDFEKFGVEKIISISAIPEWNENARKRGVKRIVLKDHDNIGEFANEVVLHVKQIIV